MSNTEFLPVTQAEAVQTTIGQTVKIGKQLMIAELTKRHAELFVNYNVAKLNASKARDLFHNTLIAELQRQVHMEMLNDSELTRFRNLYSRFSRFNGVHQTEDYPKFKTNLDMLRDFDQSDITGCLYKREGLNPFQKDFDNFLKGEGTVTVNLVMPDRKHRDDDDEYHCDEHKNPLGYVQPVSICQHTIDLYLNSIRLGKEESDLNAEYNSVELQLKNIDKVTEEMEAQLLVQELNKTEAGKAALEITAGLVGNMLGTAPQLVNKA